MSFVQHYGDPPSEKRAKLRIRSANLIISLQRNHAWCPSCKLRAFICIFRGIVVSKAEEEEKARLLAEKRRIPGSRSTNSECVSLLAAADILYTYNNTIGLPFIRGRACQINLRQAHCHRYLIKRFRLGR